MDLASFLSFMHSLSFKIIQDKEIIRHFPDALWEWARLFNLITHGLNPDERLLFANDPVLGPLFPRQTVGSLSPQSCHALLTCLGLAQQCELTPWNTEALRFLDPQIWQKGEVTWTQQTQICHSLLVLPSGESIPYLRHTITLSHQGIRHSFSIDLPVL